MVLQFPLLETIGTAFIALIVGVIFQDFFVKKWQQVRNTFYEITGYRQKHNVSLQNGDFTLGNRRTNVVVIDGNGDKKFNKDNIRVHISRPFSPVWPEEVDEYYAETLLEIQQKKEREENIPWNGSILSLRKYRISRTPDHEEYAMDLFLEELDYYRVYSTINKLESRRGILKRKYIDPFVFDNDSIYELPNAIGVCMMIKTKDEKAIFSTRSMSTGFRPGENDVSIVEGVNPKKDAPTHLLDFEKVAKRAVQEEICGVEENKINVSILGLIFDKGYNQWNIIGFIDLKLTQDEIIKRRNRGTSGKWELQSLNFIQFTPKVIMQYLSTHKMWNTGFVTVYFSLIYNHYSHKKIEKYAKKYLKKEEVSQIT